MTLSYTDTMAAHEKRTNWELYLRPFKCKYCWRYSHDVRHYRQHHHRHERQIRQHWYGQKPDVSPESAPKDLEPDFYVKITFDGQNESNPSTPIDESIEETSDEPVSNNTSSPQKIAYRCKYCNDNGYFRNLDEFIKKHLQVVHKDMPHRCGICNIGFIQASHLDDHKTCHKKSESPKDIYVCKICQRGFPRYGSLKRHEAYHKRQKLDPRVLKRQLCGLKHTCNICNQSFQTRRILRAHERVHKIPGTKMLYTCQLCWKTFKGFRYLQKHEETHNDGNTFKCSTCSQSFSSKSLLQTHESFHLGVHRPLHRPKIIIKLSDNDCKQSQPLVLPKSNGPNADALQHHEKTQTTPDNTCNQSSQPLILPKTNGPNVGTIKQHETTTHTITDDNNGKQSSHWLILPKTPDNTGNQSKRNGPNAGNLKQHETTHTITDDNNCKQSSHRLILPKTPDNTGNQSKRNGPNEGNLKQKRNTSAIPHPTTFKCQICDRSFQRLHALERHKKTHTESEFKCQICSQNFSSKSLLQAHEGIHQLLFTLKQGENQQSTQFILPKRLGPNVCNLCNKTFASHDALVTHALDHNFKHNCSFCNERFRLKSDMRAHERIHTGTPAPMYTVCRQLINPSPSRRRSQKPGQKLKCQYCGEAFQRMSSLKKHEMSHTKDRPYECKYCSKCFKYSFNLSVHEKIHTNLNNFT